MMHVYQLNAQPPVAVTDQDKSVALDRMIGKLNAFLATYNPEFIREARAIAECIKDTGEL